jgi:DNA-binding NarL/FixJ family response regulator
MRLLLVDDHQILRDGLRRSFEAAGEAVELAAQLDPDVILMDLTMPVLDGTEATRRIIAERPDQRIVVLTMHDDVERTRAAIVAGAVGYLAKGSSFADVLDTVRAVHAGETRLSPALAGHMLKAITIHAEAAEPILSERHIEILQLVADGMSTKQAARELGITQKTVHNHLNAIYRRLDAQSLTHAVLSAVRLGIIEIR